MCVIARARIHSSWACSRNAAVTWVESFVSRDWTSAWRPVTAVDSLCCSVRSRRRLVISWCCVWSSSSIWRTHVCNWTHARTYTTRTSYVHNTQVCNWARPRIIIKQKVKLEIVGTKISELCYTFKMSIKLLSMSGRTRVIVVLFDFHTAISRKTLDLWKYKSAYRRRPDITLYLLGQFFVG